MKIEKIKRKVESKIGKDLDIEVKEYNAGHWLNQETGDWVTERIYIYVDNLNEDEVEKLKGIIEFLSRSIESSTQILLK